MKYIYKHLKIIIINDAGNIPFTYLQQLIIWNEQERFPYISCIVDLEKEKKENFGKNTFLTTCTRPLTQPCQVEIAMKIQLKSSPLALFCHYNSIWSMLWKHILILMIYSVLNKRALLKYIRVKNSTDSNYRIIISDNWCNTMSSLSVPHLLLGYPANASPSRPSSDALQ